MNSPNVLAPKKGFPDRERIRLQRFISGIRVLTTHAGESGQVNRTPRVVKKLSSAGAGDLTFKMREGGSLTVAEYFRRAQNNRPLKFPDVVCVEVGNFARFIVIFVLMLFCQVGSGALIPLELCMVPPGQIMRKQVPPEKTKDVLEFATKRPDDRLASIRNGLSVCFIYFKPIANYIDAFCIAGPCLWAI
jgi:eukaryotic translation initiation factor 2C